MDYLFWLLLLLPAPALVPMQMDSPWPAVPLTLRFPNETAPDVSGSAGKTGANPET